MQYEVIPLEKFSDSVLSSSTGAHEEKFIESIEDWAEIPKFRTIQRRAEWVPSSMFSSATTQFAYLDRHVVSVSDDFFAEAYHLLEVGVR